MALFLEAAAFTPMVGSPSTLPPQVQALIGVLADFCGIDRKIALT
jgi:hypothetical protein